MISALIAALFLFNILGCSIPATTTQRPLYTFTESERISKGGFMNKEKIISFRDFRGQLAYDEDIEGIKKDVEAYIKNHPDLSEQVKSDLRGLKVTQGATASEVILLLGDPDKKMKVTAASYGADEMWIYRISKLRAFTIFIFPIFFVHEAYYLYFKDGRLQEIERHYLRQVVKQSEPASPAAIKK